MGPTRLPRCHLLHRTLSGPGHLGPAEGHPIGSRPPLVPRAEWPWDPEVPMVLEPRGWRECGWRSDWAAEGGDRPQTSRPTLTPRGPRATPRAASPGRARDTTTWTWAGKGTRCAGRTSAHCRVTCDGSWTKTHTVHEPGGAPSKGTVHSSGAGGRGHEEALGGGHLRSGQNHQMGRAEYVHLNTGEKRGRNFQKCWWAVGWGKGSPPSAALATHPHVTLGTVLPIQ